MAIGLLVIFVILALAVSVKDSQLVTAGDTKAFLAVNNSHVPSLNKFMVLMTQYGREVFWPVAGILLFLLGGWAGKKTAIIMAISMLVLIPIGTAAKDLVARERPTIPQSDFLLAADKEGSFPSGHATIVSAGAAVALTLFREDGSKKKLAVSIGLAVEALLVCISRVYVGGHYPTDVIGGILLGVGVSFIFVGFAAQIEKRLLLPAANTLKTKRQN